MGPSDSSVGFNSTKMNLPVSFQGTCGPVFVSDTHFVSYRCTLLSESASVSTAPSLQFKKDTFCLNNKKQDGNATRRFYSSFMHSLLLRPECSRNILLSGKSFALFIFFLAT